MLSNDNFDPTNFVVTLGNEKMGLTWNPKANTLLIYWVQYKRRTAADWTTATNSLSYQDISYSITGLTNGILYDVRIFGLYSQPLRSACFGESVQGWFERRNDAMKSILL